MAIINATPHAIQIYPEIAFEKLEELNPTTWVAESVDKSMLLLEIPSTGNARISTKTIGGALVEGIPTVKTVYGELTGVPDVGGEDIIVVSLPTQSMAKASGHPLASKMVSPYKVVREKANTSNVLGCMGFSYQ